MDYEDFLDIIIKEDRYDDVSMLNNKQQLLSGLLILTLNVRSLDANFSSLELFMERLKSKPDILICTESWRLQNINFYKIKEYVHYYNHSDINQSDGVVIYVRKGISHRLEITCNNQSIFMSTIIHCHDVELKVSAIYRCHTLPKDIFIENVKNFLMDNCDSRNHIITGDFNLDILKKDSYSEEFLNNFLQGGYLPYFNGITRPSNDSYENGSCIDNFFVKTDLLNLNSYKITDPFTDHFPIFLNIGLTIDKTTIKTEYSYIDFKKLDDLASQYNWSSLLTISSPEEATNLFIHEVNSLIEKSRKIVTNKKCVPRKSWITNGIIKSSNYKEKLYKKWKKDPDNLDLKSKYQNYLKHFNKVIKMSKRKFDEDMVSKNFNNKRRLWQIINYKIKPSNDKKNEIDHLIINNQKINDISAMSKSFNEYFSSIGTKLIQNFGPPNPDHLNNINMNNKTFFLKPTCEAEVINVVNSMQNKSGIVDGLSTAIIKRLLKYVAAPLSNIYNNCFSQSIWPNSLKKAVIIPLHKSGSKMQIGNFRPISMISNLSKIMEKLIHSRFIDFFHSCKLISDKQTGFLKNRGTKYSLAEVTNYIYENINSNKAVLATFLDISKAFDTVNHNLLLEKLYRYGIRGPTLQLIKSYLSNRKQCVKLNSATSDWCDVVVGVPQGSVLGPLLFLIFMNDLLEIDSRMCMYSYADDTVILCANDSWSTAELVMNKHLQCIFNWIKSNQLSLNIEKSAVMSFGSYCDSVPKSLNIHINDVNVKRVETVKYLGVILDYRLRWFEHVSSVCNKTRYLLYVIHKLKYFMSGRILKMIYYAFFHSIATYGITAWGGAYKNVISPLLNLQNRLRKVILKKDLFLESPTKLNHCFIINSVIYHFTKLQETYNLITTRIRRKIIKNVIVKKHIVTKSNLYIGIHYFNLLPDQLKSSTLVWSSLSSCVTKWLKDYLRNSE